MVPSHEPTQNSARQALMTDISDIVGTAQSMIETYGDRALPAAAERIAEFTELKDAKAAGAWRLVKSMIRRQQAKEAANASTFVR